MRAAASPTGRRAGRYVADTLAAFRRAPVEVLLAGIVAAAFSAMIALDGGRGSESWVEVAVVAMLAGTLAWTGTLLHALGAWTSERRWAVTALGLVGATLYGATLLETEPASEAWRAGLLVAAALAWLAALPVLARRPHGATDRVRLYGGRILLRMLGAGLYTGALFVGLALALRGVDGLFELDLDSDIYGYVFGWLAFAVFPWVVVGGVHGFARPPDEGDPSAAAVLRIAAFLVPPLLAIYYAILFAYAARIAITGELPGNLVSPMVLAAGALAALALLLFDPPPGAGRGLGALRLAPPLFLPLGALGLWSVLVRIRQYGWTEFRYVRFIVLAIMLGLAAAATVQLLRRRRFALHAAAPVLAGALALSAFGPWSALGVSRASQQGRLAAGLEAAGLPDGRPSSEQREVPYDVYEQIRSAARYLRDHFGTEAVVAAAPGTKVLPGRVPDLAAGLGLITTEPGPEGVLLHASLNGAADIGALGDRVFRVSALEKPPRRPGGDAQQPAQPPDSALVAIDIEDRRLYADLRALVGWLAAEVGRNNARTLPGSRAVVPIVDHAGERRGRLLVLELAVQLRGGRYEIFRLDGLASLDEAAPPSR